MSVDVEVKMLGEVPVVQIVGGIIDVGESKLSKELKRLHGAKHAKIVIDVSKTNFINSHGVGIIMYYHNALQNEGRQLVILNRNPDPDAYVARLFSATKLYKVLKIAQKLDEV